MQKVIIDPSTKIPYSLFYIKGLADVFGEENLAFSAKYFRGLERKTESHSYDHYMAFVIMDGTEIRKIIIDFRDKVSVKESAYNWCDLYAKVNFNRKLTERRFHKKMLSIAPGFGIKTWGFWKTLILCSINFSRCHFSPIVPLKAHIMDYFIPYYRRSKIENYSSNSQDTNKLKNSTGGKKYVFFISTLWDHENCLEGTNHLRKNYIEFCKLNQQVEFEGGLLAHPSHPQYAEFKEIIFSTKYSIERYIEKTKLSAFVFNTPAVHNCHGWKLGEFLAMGKAIISTPLSNELPEKLIHGKDIHIAANDAELVEAIQLLATNDEYRKHLENGAKTYYSKYAEPQRVIKSIETTSCGRGPT